MEMFGEQNCIIYGQEQENQPQKSMKQKPQSHKQSLGKYGEGIATQYLEQHGYQIIDRNFKARYGELDIIATKNTTLVFVEVKTRIGKKFGFPEEAITARKLHEIIMTSEYYNLLHPSLPKFYRIDVIALELFPDRTIKDLRHIENISQ